MKKHPTYKNAWHMLALARIMIGFVFLWAFSDKTFGLGFSTQSGQAWVSGGSPTSGFLQFGVNPDSPFASIFTSLAGMAWVDWLFMFGLLGIGLALILGVGLRIAAVSATILLVLMWAALLPLENNPVINEHLIYAAVIWVTALSRREWSVVDWWFSHKFVRSNKWLW